MSVWLRSAMISEARGLYQIMQTYWRDIVAQQPDDPVLQSGTLPYVSEAEIAALIVSPRAECVVADTGTEIYGFALAQSGSGDDDKTIIIKALAVLPQQAGQGIEEMLLTEIAQAYPEAQYIETHIVAQDLRSLQFYLYHGFVEQDQHEMSTTTDNTLPSICLKKQL